MLDLARRILVAHFDVGQKRVLLGDNITNLVKLFFFAILLIHIFYENSPTHTIILKLNML